MIFVLILQHIRKANCYYYVNMACVAVSQFNVIQEKNTKIYGLQTITSFSHHSSNLLRGISITRLYCHSSYNTLLYIGDAAVRQLIVW